MGRSTTMKNKIIVQMTIRYILSIALILLIASQSFAGGQNRAGTSAAPHLVIPVGAHYIAMGGSPVANASGIEAIFWNPAGIDRSIKDVNAMFSYRTYIADIGVNYFAVSGRFNFGTIALSLKSLSIGDIPVTTETAPDGTGEIFNPTYFVLGVSYSRQLTDRISIGVSTNLINESFAQVRSMGISFDAGVQYRSLLAIPKLDIGVTIKNIGPPMKYEGSGLWREANVPGSQRGVTNYKVEPATFELPSVIEIGLTYHLMKVDENELSLSTTFQNNNYAYDEYRIGTEYVYDNKLFVRFGYLLGAASTSDRPHIFQDFTIGTGINFEDVGGTQISFDYAFVPVKYFDNNHVVALKVGF